MLTRWAKKLHLFPDGTGGGVRLSFVMGDHAFEAAIALSLPRPAKIPPIIVGRFVSCGYAAFVLLQIGWELNDRCSRRRNYRVNSTRTWRDIKSSLTPTLESAVHMKKTDVIREAHRKVGLAIEALDKGDIAEALRLFGRSEDD